MPGMYRFVVVGAALLSVATVSGASAADLAARTYTKAPPLAPVYDWSGFYVGGNAGFASSHDCYTVTSVAGAVVAPNSEGCHDATGGVIGGQVGYRWQFTNWVVGLEGQGDWTSLKGSNASQAAGTIPYTNQTKTDAFGLFTGQVGYTWNNVLWYMKGGGAVTDNKYSSYFSATGTVFNQASETRWGGVIGAGVEVGFAPNWSVGFDYDHLFMGKNDITFPTSALAAARTDSIKQDVDIGTVRVNYRFGGPIVAKY